MSPSILHALGGLGLFLLGMKIMTDGLKAVAEDRLHRWLARVTHTPLSGAATGALTTAVIQSSTATTVATVGFVGAGLLTFEQALGVIFGANIGTTITGWIVAVVGFKIKLGDTSLLLLFVGALITLLAKGRWRQIGRILCGFALLFLGIEFLKEGLSEAHARLNLGGMAAEDFGGRLALVGIGIVLTLLTQSSSATIATTLAGLSSGIVTAPQALAMVIGADIGTTGTAALATLGASTDSKRTGWSHVIYNLLTGMMAFFLIPLYLWIVDRLQPGAAEANPHLVTTAFHTSFNALGVMMILPLTRGFAVLMYRIIPRGEPSPTAVLEARLIDSPAAAIEALRSAVTGTARLTIAHLSEALEDPPKCGKEDQLQSLSRAAFQCREFLGLLVSEAGGSGIQRELPDLIHALDHTDRLLDRCRDGERIAHLGDMKAMAEERVQLLQASRRLGAFLSDPTGAPDPRETLAALADQLETDHRHVRRDLIRLSVGGRRHPSELDKDLDALRWLRRCAWHVAKVSHYLHRG